MIGGKKFSRTMFLSSLNFVLICEPSEENVLPREKKRVTFFHLLKQAIKKSFTCKDDFCFLFFLLSFVKKGERCVVVVFFVVKF